MNTLVIHPKDRSTEFLTRVYENIDANVVTGGVDKPTLRQMVEDHDRVIMLGHGSPWGLMSVGQFPDAGPDIIDYTFRGALEKKDNSIFIWCNADRFVQQQGLHGFYTGMFISEQWEAHSHQVAASAEQVEESNERFAEAMNGSAWWPRTSFIYRSVRRRYGALAVRNPVARYNHERLYASEKRA